jgi:hypothetical protein
MPFLRLPRFALRLALLLALTQSASALQLGETRAQLVLRHGPPNDEDHARNLATYFWDGWSAQLEFHGSTVGRITYKRDWYLQDEQIASLLEANGGAGRWTEISGPSDKNRLWARDDGAAASCMRFRPLNIVFESGPESGGPPTGPKGAAQASPSPATSSAADAPGQPVAEPVPVAPSVPAAPESTATEPITHPVDPPKSTPERQSVAVAPATPGLAFAPAAALLVVLGGIALYLFKRRPYPVKARPAAASAMAPPRPIAGRAPDRRELNSGQLESLITGMFRHEGYRVELSAAAGSENGFDLTLRRDSETVLVQCQHGKFAQVGDSDVRNFLHAITAAGASRGILLTTGEFTDGARRFADGHGVGLLDGIALKDRLAANPTPLKRELAAVGIRDSVSAQARTRTD